MTCPYIWLKDQFFILSFFFQYKIYICFLRKIVDLITMSRNVLMKLYLCGKILAEGLRTPPHKKCSHPCCRVWVWAPHVLSRHSPLLITAEEESSLQCIHLCHLQNRTQGGQQALSPMGHSKGEGKHKARADRDQAIKAENRSQRTWGMSHFSPLFWMIWEKKLERLTAGSQVCSWCC